MRFAVISDTHGNLTALEAVAADLAITAPDVVFHGGDVADGGCRPAEVIDLILSRGWRAVLGNVDEMLFRPEALEAFARRSTAPAAMWNAVREIAAFTRESIGEHRLRWMASLPMKLEEDGLSIVHASPTTTWETPGSSATGEKLHATYGTLPGPIIVFGHTHIPFVRQIDINGSRRCIANSGSVSLSFDGDPSASYALIEKGSVTIRRVPYDIESEIRAMEASKMPRTAWIASMLRDARPMLE